MLLSVHPITVSLLIAMGPGEPVADPCAGEIDGQPLTLLEVWDLSRQAEPGYVAASEAVTAEVASRTAVRRERLPLLALEAAGDQGQRARPGEERAFGVGARGDVRLVAGWTLLESGRGWREAEIGRRAEAVRLAGDVFDTEFRGVVGRSYVDAAAEAARLAIVTEERGAVAELGRVVRLRREAGVEIEYDAFLIEEALARYDRRVTEATHRAEAARADLALFTGLCAQAVAFTPRLDVSPRVAAADANPRVRLLREQAATREVAAGAVLRQDLWRVQVIGAAGPYVSQAFPDGAVEPEYIVGVAATLNPDLPGIRRSRAVAEAALARSVGYEAASVQRAVERELSRLALGWDRFDQRRRELDRERELTERRAEAAELRWTAGVDRWREVVDARERLLDVRLAALELEREIARAMLAYGEGAGDLDSLPRWLGQEVAP